MYVSNMYMCRVLHTYINEYTLHMTIWCAWPPPKKTWSQPNSLFGEIFVWFSDVRCMPSVDIFSGIVCHQRIINKIVLQQIVRTFAFETSVRWKYNNQGRYDCFKIADLYFSRTTAFTPAKHSRVVVFTTARPWLMSNGWSQIGRWYEIVLYVFEVFLKHFLDGSI